ncbi:MAG: lysine--tRNA ligase [Candidatus Parvarchaeota archaeon]|nr:lysine--tRNA ligase [Candidatus Jingweiarchaeum tengchongense]MCW1298482.1 lysine--tRNA ligase [Candidatus Jingweiarchaeum tengchongense]MCW1300272.1 lysine--tRNA ligase [Candidatus Jingweiarchaeum tengchongense]MCW1304494.1 lysine--tRNA ligase [Candidatus Jingweiarchaeum tengchongense]MCW1305778.1 lysine--tRNA ligase [Candidatus Jingweiarchaeum tengchongense]
MDEGNIHWSENIADKIISGKREPYIISCGITTSGPVHFGTMCEFLFPAAIALQLKERKKKVKHFFYGDILDAFDSIPAPLEKYKKKLEEHLGKPLCDVPDPFECCDSYGEHFLNETKKIIKKLGLKIEVLKMNELYAKGLFDELALFFLKNYDKTREIVFRTSLKKDEGQEWNPIMPICEKCGRISTTIVESFDENGNIKYSCTRDVGYTKGCGYKGEMNIKLHKYKITWRLHWPSEMKVLNVSAEGAGVDHHTRGGSWDTCEAVFRELFNQEPPITWMHGFILYHGKKSSKSKGVGIDVKEALKIIPPELLKYILFFPDISQNKDLDPSGYSMIKYFDDYKKIADMIERGGEELTRAERKKIVAYKLSTKKRKWRIDISELIIKYQLYKDKDKIIEKCEDKTGAKYLYPYIKQWFKKKFAPEELLFSYEPRRIDEIELVKEWAMNLNENMKAIDVHNSVYNFAKSKNIEAPEMFKILYKCLINKEMGPRLGMLVDAIGVKKVREDILNL